MDCTMTSWLVRGRPRQFIEMWENSRCSILFHFDVPGGRWHTVMVRPVSAANAASSVFHSRVREPLDPPPSAVISSRDAFGEELAADCHQRRIVATANAAVSWSVPTLTQPVFAPRSYTPYGLALPRVGSMKSWTLTCSGSPAGCHSLPPFLYGPTSSFFLVSTLITGSPAVRCCPAWSLRWENWASRSGCCPPSIVLALPCRLKPCSCSSRATVSAPTRCPAEVSSPASLRVDSVVQHSEDSGSPRRVGSTSLSSATSSAGSVAVTVLRPPPSRRTRFSGACPDSNSATPAEIRDRDTPLAWATAAMPPWPNDRASPAMTRRC